jgi:molecular chaperone DnaJ
MYGGPKGDLYIQVRIKPHKELIRRGSDIIHEVEINFPQAALGTEIEVPVLGGRETIKVPSGTQNGDIIRLKKRGMKGRFGYGDQLIHVTVTVPKKLSRKERQLIQELEKELGKKKGIFG